MFQDNYIDKKIGEKLLAESQKRDKEHKSSGKLSASSLGNPLQWQVLKYLGVPQKPFDEYVVRKFLRGNQIEEWFVDQVEPIEKQKFMEYKNVVGYGDAIVDTKNWQFNKGIIPLEVKSVTNAKFRRILKEKKPQRSHQMQAGLYALAEGKEFYALSYIASDDLRVHTWIFRTEDIAPEIHKAIREYDWAIENKVIPIFKATEGWQEKDDYCNYPNFRDLSQEELTIKAKQLYGEREKNN